MNKKTPWLLTVGLAIYVSLFVLRDILQIHIPGMTFMLWGGLLLFLPRAEMMKAIFFMMPFANGVPGYTILLSLFLLIIKSNRINIWQIIPPVIITLLEFASVAFYDFDIRFNSVISYISFIFFFFFILFDKDSRIDKRDCVKFFCYGTAITLLIVYIPIIVNHGVLSLIMGELRSGMAMGVENIEDAEGHLVMNANTIAYFSVTLLSLLLLGRSRIHITSKIFYYVSIVISLLAGILSFSRTWLLLTVIVIVLYSFNAKHRVLAITLYAMCALVIMTTQNLAIESISGVFQTRMEDETFETGGGRFDIFTDYNNTWIESSRFILIGSGASHYRLALNKEHSMHNGLQQIWICHGLLGFAVFMISILQFLKMHSKRKLKHIYYLPIIACFIFDQSIQFLVPYQLMLPFLPTLYVLAFNNERPYRNDPHLSKTLCKS